MNVNILKIKNGKFRRAIVLGAFLVSCIVLVGGCWAFIHHKLNKGRVQLIAAAPAPSPVYVNNEKRTFSSPINDLRISLEPSMGGSMKEGADLFRQEVLQSSGKLSSLIRITPQMRGTWLVTHSIDSQRGNMLVFHPETPWLPNKKYEVQVSPKIFSSHVKLGNKKVSFTTAPNAVTIDEFFFTPSTQKKHMSLFGRAHFDYAVKPEAVKGVSLTLNNKELTPQVTLVGERVLFIDYDNVPLTNQEQEVALRIKWDKMSAKSFLTLDSVNKFFNLKEVKILPPSRIGQPYTLAAEFTDLINAQKLLADKKVKAWLLPIDKKKVWKEQSVEAVRKELSKATEITLKAIPGISSVPSFQIVSDLQTRNQQRYAFVEFEAGITSEGDFVSTKAQAFILPIQKFPKRLNIVGTGSLLSLKKTPVLQFVSQGINKAEIRVSRIHRSDINHLVSQTKGDISKPCFGYTNYGGYYYDDDEEEEEGDHSSYGYSCGGYPSFDEYNISDVFRKTIPLADNDIKPNFFTLNLSDYLKAGSSGVFIIDATDEKEEVNQRRLILVSDIGLMYKAEEKGLKVFALELSSQEPLAGAKVDLLARNGTIVKTQYTNSQGVADFELSSKYSPEKEPVALIVSKGDDYSFIPLESGKREVNYGRFDVGGADPNQQQNNLDVLLFTDRGIYRPGETVNFALVAKNKRWTSTAGLPIQLRIEDPRGKTVFDKKVSLSATGLRDFTFSTETSSPTGIYSIHAYHEDKRYIAGGSFEVKEFQEDKLKIKATLESPANKGWQPLEGLKGLVDVQNLFGTPAVGNPVDMEVRLYPTTFIFSQYPEYSFADTMQRKENIKTETLSFKSLKTSPSGEVVQPIDLSSYGKGTYKLVLRAEAFEQESGRSVQAQDTLLVSSNPYVMGYKTKADLSYLPQHSRQTVDFIALDPNLNKIALNDLTVHLFSRQYVSVPVRSHHSFRYQSVLQESPISTKPFQLRKEGTTYTLPTDSPGLYAMEIHNAGDEKIMRLEFMVSGNGNVSYNMERSAELRLNLEKNTVSPGETIHFNVTAPYTGIGLITVEKEKVYAYKWFKTTTSSSTQSITLPTNLVGSAYLNVSFLRSLDSREILLNPHSYATAPFYVIPSQHISKIDLKSAELVKPGETLKVSYSTSVPAQIIIYGASEGILQVARYKLPDPLAYFFPKQRLGVRTYQLWDLVMADPHILREIYGIGGDQDAEAALAEMGLNPFARKTEKPVAFWSGILESSPTPRTYTYQVPDYFNGKVRIMAVAVSSQTVASAQKDVLVRAPLVLSAGGPVAVAPGDTFEASVKVSNNYDQTTRDDVTVQIKTSPGLQVVGNTRQTVHVPYKKETTVSFQVKALDQLGDAKISFESSLADSTVTAKRDITLSVRPASAYRVSIDTGNGKGNFAIKQFEKRNLYDAFSKRQIAISDSPLVVALGLGSYLEKFPHGCTEQIVSQAFPTLVFYAATGDKAQAMETFEKTHKKLQMRQQSGGGFSLWDTGSDTNMYASLYAFHMLTEAEQLGYPVSKDLKERALEWVKRTAKDGSYTDPRMSAYAYYLAARNGVLLTSDLYNLEEYLNKNQPDWKNSVTGVYMAAVYKLLQNEEKALKIIKSYKPEKTYSFYNDYDSSTARNATYLYIVGMHFPQLLQGSTARQLLDSLLEDVRAKHYNTMTAAWSMLALNVYAQNHMLTAQDVEVIVDGKRLELAAQSNHILVADFAAGTKAFEVKTKLATPLYYAITQQGYDKDVVSASSQGLEVSRVYQVKEPVGQVGEEIEVKITARALKKSVQNAVISDLLPGGMSIVSGSFNASGHVDYHDEREDRLLIYGPISTQGITYTYKVKLTSVGTFRVPAVTAAGLYDTALSATGAENTFVVKPRE